MFSCHIYQQAAGIQRLPQNLIYSQKSRSLPVFRTWEPFLQTNNLIIIPCVLFLFIVFAHSKFEQCPINDLLVRRARTRGKPVACRGNKDQHRGNASRALLSLSLKYCLSFPDLQRIHVSIFKARIECFGWRAHARMASQCKIFVSRVYLAL